MPLPDRIPRLRRALLAVASLVAVVGLTACGGGSSQKSRFADNLRKLGLSQQESSCVTDRLYASLDSGELDELFSAAQQNSGNQAAIPLPLRQKLYAAVAPCAPTSGPATG